MQLPFSLDCISLSDLNLLNQTPLALYLGAEMHTDADPFSSVILVIVATLWAIWKCKNVTTFEGKVVSASQAHNYCSHMVMICQAPVCNWIWFVNCWLPGVANADLWWGASFVRQFVKPFTLYLWKAWWLYLYLWVALGFVGFLMECKHQAAALLCCCLQFYKLWFRQVPRRILTNAGKLANFITSYFMHIAWSYIFFFLCNIYVKHHMC